MPVMVVNVWETGHLTCAIASRPTKTKTAVNVSPWFLMTASKWVLIALAVVDSLSFSGQTAADLATGAAVVTAAGAAGGAIVGGTAAGGAVGATLGFLVRWRGSMLGCLRVA